MKKYNNLDFIAVIIWILPFAFLYKIYPTLPVKVPLHFNIDGKADREGSPHELLTGLLIMTFIGITAALIIRFIPLMYPDKMFKNSFGKFQKLFVGISILIAVIQMVVIVSASHSLNYIK